MQNKKQIVRAALHAGSWCPKNQTKVSHDIISYLNQAEIVHKDASRKIKAIIGPHSGFKYSGPVAAWSYKYLETLPQNANLRVFLLGPSHFKYLQGISLSSCTELETPIGTLLTDIEIIQRLKHEISSVVFSKKEEEREHSLEMHLPFIKKMMGNAKIIPMLVGQLNEEELDKIGSLLSSYFDSENTIFVISSDFCHWGQRFNYQPFDGKGRIWEYISKLDHEGMALIEKKNLADFEQYLNSTGNNICGSSSIKVLLSTISHSNRKIATKFVRYDQSSQVDSEEQSSVSYATAITYLLD